MRLLRLHFGAALQLELDAPTNTSKRPRISIMSFSLSIPTDKSIGPLALTVNTGQMLFILGANGTGKSSLMQAFASASNNKTRRITAHRQTWFRSGSPEFTGKQRSDYG